MNATRTLLLSLGLSSLALAAGAPPAAGMSHGADDASAEATFHDLSGRDVGHATLEQTPNGVLLLGTFTGLKPGTHALHVHETGLCEPPFTSAGGHFAPGDSAHGVRDEENPHAGDLLNFHVATSGDAKVEMLSTRITLKEGKTSVFDSDGSALIVHSGRDDHRTDPAGDAGDHIACAVIERTGAAEAAADPTKTSAQVSKETQASKKNMQQAAAARTKETQGAPGDAPAVSTPAPEQSSTKTLDAADTVEVIAVDADAQTLTVESSPVAGALPERTVYDVDANTVIRSGAETLKLAALEPGARVVVAADLEPEVEPGVDEPDRNVLAREVQVVIRADGSRATGGAGAE